MSNNLISTIRGIIQRNEDALMQEWTQNQRDASDQSNRLISDAELGSQCREFLTLFGQALATGQVNDIHGSEWQEACQMLADVSRSRTRQGFSPGQTARFVFSIKRPLTQTLRKNLPPGDESGETIWQISELLDKLGLYTTEVHQQTREDVILRQQEEMLELSTPVVKLFDGILALPLIGTLDSGRTQTVMESLLQTIVDTGSEIAILDITGVPTVDTLTAQHLLKTVAAARLMGAECIISGIRPQIAQTVVQLGVDLSSVITKASLADAFAVALKRLNLQVVRLDDGR